MKNKHKLSYNEFVVFRVVCQATGLALSLGQISKRTGGMAKSSVARAAAGLAQKGYVRRQKSVRIQKSCTQVVQRRAVYKYRINKQLRDVVFRRGCYYKYSSNNKYIYIYINNKKYMIYTKEYYSCRRVTNIYNNKYKRRELKKMDGQAELIPVGKRYKKKRKSSLSVLMRIFAREHRKLYGTFYRPKNGEFVFAQKEINQMLADFREAYGKADADRKQKLTSGPYGNYLRSTMEPVRVLIWCIKHIYQGPLKNREFPFEEGFRDFKHIIWATRMYRTAYEDDWYERRWRRKITVVNKPETEKAAAPIEVESEEPELDEETLIENARKRREELIEALNEGGNMGVKKGSKRAVCGNPSCDRYGKTQTLEPEWLGRHGWVCKTCHGIVEPWKSNKMLAEKKDEEQTPSATTAEDADTLKPEEPAPPEPEAITEGGEPTEDDSWLEGNEPEEMSRPKEEPMYPGKPAPKLKVDSVAECPKCKARFTVNEHTNGCPACGNQSIRAYVPPKKKNP